MSGEHKLPEQMPDFATRLGRMIKTPKPCSCYMCGNPRKFEGKITRKEALEISRDTLLKAEAERREAYGQVCLPGRCARRGEVALQGLKTASNVL